MVSFARFSVALALLVSPVLAGQQSSPAAPAVPAAASVPAAESQTSPAVRPPDSSDDRPAATADTQPGMPAPKLSEKEAKKRAHDAEKAAREKEKDATYLKLQGDEIVAPTLDADGKPVELAPCARKDRECQKKRKAMLHRKKVGMKIENGTLTVDGWTGKARLNYDISEVKFLYVSIPGQGTVIASMEQFPNSTPQKKALDGKTLTIQTPGDHVVQISSDNNLVDKKDHIIYVATDTGYTQPGRFPTIGYGSTAKAPYNWPGVRPLREDELKISAKAPPLPSGMSVSEMKLPCQRVLPGEHPKPVKINGITMTPEACPATVVKPAAGAATPSATVPAASAAVSDPTRP